MGFFDKARCGDCVFYSPSQGYCNVRNKKNSPEGNCVDFRTEDSFKDIKGAKCCNCVYYSLNQCYCNARNQKNSPTGSCVDFRKK